jgi:hypothetical protein
MFPGAHRTTSFSRSNPRNFWCARRKRTDRGADRSLRSPPLEHLMGIGARHVLVGELAREACAVASVIDVGRGVAEDRVQPRPHVARRIEP